MKSLLKIFGLLAIASLLFFACSEPNNPVEPDYPDKPDVPAGSEVVDLVALGLVMDDAWAGSTVDADGTINYKSDFGACKLGGEPKFKTGDKVEIEFAEAPAGVQIYWVDDPYEMETFSWGEGIASKNCHYSGPLNGDKIEFGEFADNVFTYTFEGDATFISVQAAGNQTAAKAKIASAKVIKIQ